MRSAASAAASTPPMAAWRPRVLITGSRTGRGGKAAPALLKWSTLATPGVSDLSNGTSSSMGGLLVGSWCMATGLVGASGYCQPKGVPASPRNDACYTAQKPFAGDQQAPRLGTSSSGRPKVI